MTESESRNVQINSSQLSVVEKMKANKLKRKHKQDLDTSNSSGVQIVSIPLEQLESAPEEWMELFPPMSATKLEETIRSIREIGLCSPIIVKEREINQNEGAKRYQILSGHNRTKAFTILRDAIDKSIEEESTKPSINENMIRSLKIERKKYEAIPAIIKPATLSNVKAKMIFTDTNWATRDNLNSLEKSRVIVEKYMLVKQDDNSLLSGEIDKLIANDYGITEKQVNNYKALSRLIEEVQPLVVNINDKNRLNIDTAVRVARLTEGTQRELYNKYLKEPEGCKTLNKCYRKIKKGCNIEDLDTIIDLYKKELESKGKDDGEVIFYYKNNDENREVVVKYPKGDELYIKPLIAAFVGEDIETLSMAKGKRHTIGGITYIIKQ